MNEHWKLELHCKTCKECIPGFNEKQSDDEEHTTHDWQKVSDKSTECVYVAENGDFRTAPATPGLLKINVPSIFKLAP